MHVVYVIFILNDFFQGGDERFNMYKYFYFFSIRLDPFIRWTIYLIILDSFIRWIIYLIADIFEIILNL